MNEMREDNPEKYLFLRVLNLRLQVLQVDGLAREVPVLGIGDLALQGFLDLRESRVNLRNRLVGLHANAFPLTI